MAEDSTWKAPGEDEDDALEDLAYKSARDAILFAVEISSSMMAAPSSTENGSVDSAAMATLKCAYLLMQQRIISSPKDMMGILLYGTEKTKFREEEHSQGLAYPNCYLLMDLNIPAAADVKALRRLVAEVEEFESFVKPSTKPASMANVLFCANQIFTTKAPNITSRRLFLVTDEDDPHADAKALKSTANVRAKDLYDLGVTIELFPISKSNSEFNRAKFYEDIIYSNPSSDLDAPSPNANDTTKLVAGGISLLNDLLTSIRSKAMPRRALFSSVPLEIGPGLKISVKGYIIFKRQEPHRSCYVWVAGQKAQIARGVTTQFADESTKVVDPTDIKKAYRFGGEQILFSKEETAALRYFGDPVIRIIGFKPASFLPIWANIRPSIFIYPSEEHFVGSIRIFSALYQKLLADQKMAIAWYVPRTNTTPTIAAILPGEERLDEAGRQRIPPGLWLIPLPFVDDIRQNPDVSSIEAPKPLVDAMRQVVRALHLPKAQYLPEKYSNPALQWHYQILQALALDEELPEKPVDRTVPKYRQMNKNAGAFIAHWNAELDRQFLLWQDQRSAAESTLVKRPASRSTLHGGAPKRSRVDVDDAIDDAEMKKHFEKNTAGMLTVAILRAWLQSKRLEVTGKKSDLVDRIEIYFDSH